ncbi:MAG: ABC transporter, partial [Rhodocyclaceae bacterium]
MNSESSALPSAYSDYLGPAVPDSWRPLLDKALQAGEKVLASLNLDLDAALQFRSGLVALTDRRLLAWDLQAKDWQVWTFRNGMALRHRDHAGVASLDLVDGDGKLAGWRFTLAQDPAARNLADRFHAQLECVLAGRQPTPPEPLTCPTCDAPLPPGTDECPTCAREIHTPPSTWTLFRLWRFVQPYKKQLLAGFLLT